MALLQPSNRQAMIHSARTAVAAVISWYVARLFRLPEAYWAVVTTLVVTQSTLGAAMTVSGQRFVGTVIGAVVGGALGTQYLHPHLHSALVFGAVVFFMGLLCALMRLDLSAYRFAGITLAIIMLIPSEWPAWVVASHRFLEVTVGIVVGLVLTAVWPGDEQMVERAAALLAKPRKAVKS